MPQHIGFKLARLPRLWRAVIDERLAPLGLTQTRWVTLYNLRRMGGGQAQCDLARAIGVEAPSLVRTLDQLAEQNLIERRPCAEDRRTKRLHLTEEAAPLLEQIEAIVDEVRDEMLAGFSAEEMDTFESMLDRIEKNGVALQRQSEQNRAG
ncbi:MULTISPECIES: transcriptional regulator SlyA [Salinicola]|uniref:Transcriptional regulator SlyA n=1 Tax=Salinicola endophyticus TaxID=1949083 RepID=A0AB74UIK7_9GAMM|nr:MULTISPECIES: transcriptional regulator SlyA [unclassified Salinicola]MCE3028949.1 transcriptional regulator SlyA [Salinicola sp. DM10]WIX34349.1 transcriptional regulator SlyA [Salinicola sp. JS01]